MKKILLVLLCLVLACPAFGAAAEAPAAPRFRTMADALNDSSSEYFSADYFIVLTEINGSWWRVEAQPDDRYRELLDFLSEAEDAQAAHQVFFDHVRELPAASAEELPEQPLSPSELAGYSGKTLRDLLADGFGIAWIEAASMDESQVAGVTKPLVLTDGSGDVYRVPVCLEYSRYSDTICFSLSKGIYSYRFICTGTEETLREAAEKGTWENLVLSEGPFGGFSRDYVADYYRTAHAPQDVMTDEQAGAVRTVKDLEQFFYVIADKNDRDRFRYIINGENCFWIGEAVPDEHYRELARALESAPEDRQDKASRELRLCGQSLPVTLKKVEMEHPPRMENLSAWIGKRVRDLLADGFELTAFYASTPVEENAATDTVLFLKDSSGHEYGSVTGNILFQEYDEFVLLVMKHGMYEYMFSLSGDAETLTRAAEDGSLAELEITEASCSGLSADAVSALGL